MAGRPLPGILRARQIGVMSRAKAHPYLTLAAISFLLALSIRLSLLLITGPLIADDSAEYQRIAENILQYGRLVDIDRLTGQLRPYTFRMPGYPLFLAFFYAIFKGPSDIAHWMLVGTQILLTSATSALSALLGMMLFSRRVGLASGILAALDPWQAFLSLSVLTEPLFSFFITLGFVLAALHFRRREQVVWVVLWGFSIGAATLIRPVAQFLFVAMVIVLLLSPGVSLRKRTKWVMASLVGFVLLVLGWRMFNLARTGDWVLETNQGMSLLWLDTYAIRPSTESDYARDPQLARARDIIGSTSPATGWHAFYDLRRELGMSEQEASKAMTAVAVENILLHPQIYLARTPSRLFSFLTGISSPLSLLKELGATEALAGIRSHLESGQLGYVALNLILRGVTIVLFLPLFLVGLYAAWRDFPQTRSLALYLLLAIGYHGLIVVIIVSNDRYRAPFHAAIWPFVALGLLYTYLAIRRYTSRFRLRH